MEAEATEENVEITEVETEKVVIEMVTTMMITRIRNINLETKSTDKMGNNTMIMTIRMMDNVAVEADTMIRGVVVIIVAEVTEVVEVEEEVNTMATAKRKSITRKTETVK